MRARAGRGGPGPRRRPRAPAAPRSSPLPVPRQGEALHWLACALYVACRKSLVPTVGSGLMEGNGVSLTRILRSARLR